MYDDDSYIVLESLYSIVIIENAVEFIMEIIIFINIIVNNNNSNIYNNGIVVSTRHHTDCITVACYFWKTIIRWSNLYYFQFSYKIHFRRTVISCNNILCRYIFLDVLLTTQLLLLLIQYIQWMNAHSQNDVANFTWIK